MVNAADEKDIQSKKQRQNARERNFDLQLKQLMQTTLGRQFVWNLLDEANVFKVTFSESHAAMSFAEGQRNFGVKLFARMLKLAPQEYALMTSENTSMEMTDGRSPDTSGE